MVVDDELGYVYYSDERFGIRKWQADPDHAEAGRELAVFGTEGYAGDREGPAIYAPRAAGRTNGTTIPDTSGTTSSTGSTGSPGRRSNGGSAGGAGLGDGYIVSSDQVQGATRVWLYSRAGAPGRPHEHAPVATIVTASDETDGLDVTAQPLPGFSQGLLVMMNSRQRNFLIYRWEDVAAAAAGQLTTR